MLGQGVPFVFYLDPGAGQDRVRRAGGGWEAAPRTEHGFHYTAIPTATYHERFGHLVFSTAVALKASRELEDGISRMETGFESSVLDQQGMVQPLPVEVEANAVWLTGIIHPGANQPFIWEMIASWDVERCPWPEESGGPETFAKIHARCCELKNENDYTKFEDAVFADLVEPERQRQRQLMVDAIEQLFTLVDLP